MVTNKAWMIPYSEGPKRLAFHIRRFRSYGSTSLLIYNRFGVWSVVRCRHVKKTRFLRFHKLKDEACLMEKRYISLRKLGLIDDHVTFWRRRLADIYWDVLPLKYRARVIDYFHEVRWNRQILHFVVYFLAVISLAVIYVLQALTLMNDEYPLWFRICAVLMGVAVLYKTGADAWRSTSDDADTVFLQILDQLARRCK